MKTICIHFPCGVSGTSACCNAKIASSRICNECGEYCIDACEECDEFDDGEDIEKEENESDNYRSSI